MIPRLGDPVKPDQTYRLRPGAYAVLWHRGRLLLTHQSEPEPELQLPGGGIDPGESILPALHREVIEETGWRISDARRVTAYRRFVYMPEYALWAEKLCHILVARPCLRLGEPTEKGHRAVWMEADRAVHALANPVDRHIVARLLRN